jgi:DNA ligase-1
MQAQLLTTEIPADVTGWWASEKFDGVRAIWTGSRLVTRHGKNLNPPAWFIAGLPTGIRLDGELWMGRGTFDALRSTIQRKGSDWAGVRYMVFDLADVGSFEERDDNLVFIPLPKHCKKVAHHELKGHDHLDEMEKNIVNAGGEGVVIRRPGSEYRPGRSADTIKVKRLTADVDRWQG